MNPWTCKACGERTSSKDGIEQRNGVYYVVCAKCDAKNKVVQTGGGTGAPTQLTVIGLIELRVVYSTDQKFDVPGQLREADFPNLEKAKAAAIPQGFSFALIDVDDGRWVYQPKFGWRFEKRDAG